MSLNRLKQYLDTTKAISHKNYKSKYSRTFSDLAPNLVFN